MSRTADRYLYAVRLLKEKYLCVRAVDVAHFLGISKSSVSITLRQLREQGLIEVEADGNLLLTQVGKTRSDCLDVRIRFFQHMLTEAGVEPSQALQDAISFSWEMSEDAFLAFRRLRADSSGF